MVIDFPENFDINIYRSKNNDLKSLNNDQLINHYKENGMKEGRICSEIYNRGCLKKILNGNFKKLEIGPFDCPVLSGKNVKYFDVLDKKGLQTRAKACQRPYPIENIPLIDYVNNNGDINIIKDKFNLVLSCHSIEHQTDLIQHLKDVNNLLEDGGYYVIICPDKNYCFDHFIKETTIADVIDMHERKNHRHSIASVIEHRALTCHNDTIRHWRGDHGEHNISSVTLQNAINEYNNTPGYIDVHSMQFTPYSFENIINLLYSLKYINIKVEKVYNTIKNSHEFYAILKK